MLCGNVFAQEPAVTLDFTDKTKWDIPTDGTNKEESSFTDGAYSIKLSSTNNYKMNNGYLILGKKNSYLELPAFDFDVVKIEVVGHSGASTAVKQNIYVGETAVSTETTGANAVTNTYEIAESAQGAGTIYRLVITSAHNTQIEKILIYKADASDTRKATSMTLNFGNNAIPTSGTVGDVLEIPTAEVIITETNENLLEYSDFTIDWTSSDESVAKIDKGKAYLYKAGTATLTAKYDGDETYKGCSASYTMTVSAAPVAEPYTSFAALQKDATSTSTPVAIKFDGQQVVFVNGSNAFIADKDGYGILVYTKDHGLTAGDVLSGTINCNLVLYQGNTEITGFDKSTLTITSAEVQPVNATIGAVTIANQSTLVTLKNVTYQAGESDKILSDDKNSIVYYDKFKTSVALEEGKTYNVTGIVVLFNTKIEICPRTAEDVEAIAAPEPEPEPEPEPDPDGYNYVYDFSAKVFEAKNDTKTLNEVEWSVEITYKDEDEDADGYFGFDKTKGQQFGSVGKPVKAMKLFTTGIPGTIKKVLVNASGAKDIDATMTVTVGENATKFTCNESESINLTSTATDYVFEGEASGLIVLTFEQTSSKAIYIKTIKILYEEGTTPEPQPETTTMKWDFTKWSEATVANLIADAAASSAEGWSDIEKATSTEPTELSKDNCFWATTTPDANGELSANGVVIEELKGLVWNSSYTTARSLAIAVNYPETSLGTYAGGAYLWLGGKGKDCFTIKNVKVGSELKVVAESHKPAEGRGIQLKIDGANFGEAFIPTAQATQTWTITKEGAEKVDVVIANTNGCHIYSIEAEIVESAEPEPEPEPEPQPHDPVELVWDYTEANIPTSGPDNGLYYSGYVNDAAGTNNSLHGVKLNSSGYAYFAKPAVAGKLTLTFGNRKNADAYAVNVYACTIADGAATKGDLIGEVAVAESPGTGSIEIGADVTGIYIDRKTGSEGVLQKIVFKETVARTFVDFEITNDQLKGEFDASTLPTGVTFTGTQRNDSHGYGNVTLTVPVDGTVKFSIGGCNYANPATCKVTNAEGKLLAEPNLKTDKCYHQDGSVVTYIYVGEPTTLTFSDIAYLPYFKAEATEVSEAVITYKDQDGKELGTKTVYEGDPIGEIPYTEADLTIPEGMKFRGWIYSNNVKVKATDIVTGNVTVKASVTAIEEAPTVGSIQTYDLTQSTFYPEDHENFGVENAAYYNNHGFNFNEGGSFTVNVTGKAQIVLTLCQYGNGTTIQVLNAEGAVVSDSVAAKAETDGGTAIVNYEGPAGMLKFTFAAQTYLHKVTVYNVSEFLAKDEQSGYYIVPAGDAAGLVMALNAAAAEADSKIFLPNGTYDLGEATLTTISGKNVSIIGQSMESVIIKNAPDISMEGLGKADLFNNTAEGLYMQDLTLQNALDYYKAGTGRAPTLHDQGTKTINKNVRHLSYQDTYYSHKVGGLYYFEGGEIHGTVDYLCGNGKVYFNEVKLINEKRSSATIAANSELYVFNNCTVENNADSYNLGRAWSDNPVCIYLNTTLLDGGEKLIGTRWNLSGINCDFSIAGEYNTRDAAGNNITPAENNVTFKKQNTTMNTILSAEMAATYSIEKVLGEWAATAQAETKQVDAPAARFENGNIVWEAVAGATAYAIFKNGELVAITTETSFLAEDKAADLYTIRSANARGGFGAAAEVNGNATSINAVKAENGNDVIYNLQGVRVAKAQKGLYIVNGKKVIVK